MGQKLRRNKTYNDTFIGMRAIIFLFTLLLRDSRPSGRLSLITRHSPGWRNTSLFGDCHMPRRIILLGSDGRSPGVWRTARQGRVAAEMASHGLGTRSPVSGPARLGGQGGSAHGGGGGGLFPAWSWSRFHWACGEGQDAPRPVICYSCLELSHDL